MTTTFTDGQTAYETGLLSNRAWTRKDGTWWRWFTNAIPGDPPAHDLQAPDHWVARELAHGRLRLDATSPPTGTASITSTHDGGTCVGHLEYEAKLSADGSFDTFLSKARPCEPDTNAHHPNQLPQAAYDALANAYQLAEDPTRKPGDVIRKMSEAIQVALDLHHAPAPPTTEPWEAISTDVDHPTDAYVNGVPGRYLRTPHGVSMIGPHGESIGWVADLEDVTSVEPLTGDPR